MSKVISFFKRRHKAQDSFETLIAPHLDTLYQQAYKYTGSEHEAEDLLQDVLVEVYQKCETLRVAPVRRAWLTRCMYCGFIDRYRKKKALPIFEDIDSEAGAQVLTIPPKRTTGTNKYSKA